MVEFFTSQVVERDGHYLKTIVLRCIATKTLGWPTLSEVQFARQDPYLRAGRHAFPLMLSKVGRRWKLWIAVESCSSWGLVLSALIGSVSSFKRRIFPDFALILHEYLKADGSQLVSPVPSPQGCGTSRIH